MFYTLRYQLLMTVRDTNAMQNTFFRGISGTVRYIPSTSMNASRQLSEKNKFVFVASMICIGKITFRKSFPVSTGFCFPCLSLYHCA